MIILFFVSFFLLSTSADDEGPKFVRTAYAADPDGLPSMEYITVSYYTNAKQPCTQAKWWSEGNQSHGSAKGMQKAWHVKYSGFDHHVLVGPLLADTTYSIEVGCPGTAVAPPIQRTMPPSSYDGRTLRFGVVGDYGLDGSDLPGVLAGLESVNPDATLHIGDISYADDHPFDYHGVYTDWMGRLSPLFNLTHYMVLVGNHEFSTSFGDPLLYFASRYFKTYNTRFRMPQSRGRPPSAAQNHSMFYNYNVGPVSFVVYDSECSYSGSPYCNDGHMKFGLQQGFLRAALTEAAAARSQRPWIVVMGHRPVYSSHPGFSRDGKPSGKPTAALQQLLEPLAHEFNVDLVICGHVHWYERTHPVVDSKVMPAGQAPVYVTNGHAGSIEGIVTAQVDPLPPWSAVIKKLTGYSQILVNQNKLEWTMFAANNRSIMDKFTLYKN